MKNDRYIEYIQLAKKIVADADLLYVQYNEIAFGIILKHLIDNDIRSTTEFDEAVDAAVEARLESAREERRDRD